MSEQRATGESTGVDIGERLRALPTVAVVISTGDYQELDALLGDGLIEVVEGELEATLSRDIGVFYRVQDNRRGIAEALDTTSEDVIGKSVIFGRLIEQTAERTTLIPVVSRRVKGHVHHSGYEGVVIRVSNQALESGDARLAMLPGGLEDLEDVTKDSGVGVQEEAAGRAIARWVGIPYLEWLSNSDIGPK